MDLRMGVVPELREAWEVMVRERRATSRAKSLQRGIKDDKGTDLRSGQMEMLSWRRMGSWSRMKDQ